MPVSFLFVALLAATDGDRIPPPRSAEPLHPQIDVRIAAGYENFAKLAAPRADDAEFVRRVYLDLTGTHPDGRRDARVPRRQVAEQARAAHRQAPRQPRLRPPHGLVLGRDADGAPRATRRCRGPRGKHSCAPRSPRTGRTTSSSARCSPATARTPKTRAAAKFLLDRDLEPNLVTRDIVARLPRPQPPVRPVPRPPAHRRLQAGRLLRHPGVPEPLVSVPERRRRRRR